MPPVGKPSCQKLTRRKKQHRKSYLETAEKSHASCSERYHYRTMSFLERYLQTKRYLVQSDLSTKDLIGKSYFKSTGKHSNAMRMLGESKLVVMQTGFADKNVLHYNNCFHLVCSLMNKSSVKPLYITACLLVPWKESCSGKKKDYEKQHRKVHQRRSRAKSDLGSGFPRISQKAQKT